VIQAIARCGWTALGCDVVLATTDARQIGRAQSLVAEVLEAVDDACSRFRSDSELSRVNARAGKEIRISALLCEVIAAALDAAAFTDGLVDPTVGPALVAAGYDATFAAVRADGPALTLDPHPVPGWQSIQVDRTQGRLHTPLDVQLDLGAIGKAWAADRAAEIVFDDIRCGVLVSCGGDVAMRGEPPADGWPIEVSELGPGQGHAEVVLIDTGGLATSGTAARRWRRGGVTLHHIIDPRDGLPADTPWLAVSATGHRCVDANTATTAAVVLGPSAPDWLDSRRIAARLVGRDGSVVRTGGWPA
jgi:thiamine biosynthesis lipoprotein ApbE